MSRNLKTFLMAVALVTGSASASAVFAETPSAANPTQQDQAKPNGQGMMNGQGQGMNGQGMMGGGGMMNMMSEMTRMMDNCNRMMESGMHGSATPQKPAPGGSHG